MTPDQIIDQLHARLNTAGRAHVQYPQPVDPAFLADGTRLSIQASSFHYCTPRQNTGPWTSVEVGFPSREIPELLPYAEDPEAPTGTVYGYVPVDVLARVIIDAGGFAKEN